jgi:hypothetical protein
MSDQRSQVLESVVGSTADGRTNVLMDAALMQLRDEVRALAERVRDIEDRPRSPRLSDLQLGQSSTRP